MFLSYRELEDFLAELHRVAPEKRTAFKGRLKHFQRLGWPAGTNKGKGARVEYGIGQTMSLAVGLEMLQLGLTPERVVEHFQYGAGNLAAGFREALADYGPFAEPIFYAFSPESLGSLRGEGLEQGGLVSVLVSRSQVGELFRHEHPLMRMRRFAFINLTELLDAYISCFAPKGLGAAENLKKPMENWDKVESDQLRKRWTSPPESRDGNP